MDVRFYTFSKRVNSTKQPTGITYTTKSCLWKENTSEHDPVVEVAGGLTAAWNYAYIPDWGKMYFIRDAVTVANGITQYYLTEDVMGTYKSQIGSSKQYVAFCSDSSYYDKYKVDPRVAVSTTKVVSHTEKAISTLSSVGTYILTVFNNSPSANCVGFGVSYALNATAMGNLRNAMGDPTIMQSLASYFGGTPLESIYSCVWVPYVVSSSDGQSITSVTIGNQVFNVGSGVRLNGYVTHAESVSISITGLRDDFRRCEPYTSANLYLPGVGVMDLNLSDWIGSSYVNVSCVFEIASGNMMYYLRDDDGNLIQTASCSLAAQCPLGQMTVNTGGVVNAIGGVVGGAIALGSGSGIAVAAGGAALLASGASAVLNMNKRAPSISGHTGGRLNAIYTDAELTIYEVQTENPLNSDYKEIRGLPCGKVLTISNLTDYIQCEGASVEISGSQIEAEEINRYMNEGFYRE